MNHTLRHKGIRSGRACNNGLVLRQQTVVATQEPVEPKKQGVEKKEFEEKATFEMRMQAVSSELVMLQEMIGSFEKEV